MHTYTWVCVCKYLSKDFLLLEVFYENRNGYIEVCWFFGVWGFFVSFFLNWEGKDAVFY